jgi:hypothetical protein
MFWSIRAALPSPGQVARNGSTGWVQRGSSHPPDRAKRHRPCDPQLRVPRRSWLRFSLDVLAILLALLVALAIGSLLGGSRARSSVSGRAAPFDPMTGALVTSAVPDW